MTSEQPRHADTLHRLQRIIDALANSVSRDGDSVSPPGGEIEEIRRQDLEFLSCYLRIKDPRRRELLFILCKAMSDEGRTQP